MNYIGMICQKSGYIPSLKIYAQGFVAWEEKRTSLGRGGKDVSEIGNGKIVEVSCHL